MNPIKNNRLVSDITFALRLQKFIENTHVDDAWSYEEKLYLLDITDKLLNYQVKTVEDEDEIKYLKNNGIL